jgi:6-pyruvoyltetrahydropterin/6-carboxytetrahydropterin synthase
MYKLAVKKDFISQHFLVGGDWGPENQKHSHHYQLEVQLSGKDLDSHGFVVDIVKVNDHLEKLISSYKDKTLNDLPGFKSINPSIENLARVSYQTLYASLYEKRISALSVKVWEDNIAWVIYQGE